MPKVIDRGGKNPTTWTDAQKELVIGGQKPTGVLPKAVSEGIFGHKLVNEGIFGPESYRPVKTPDGVFFNPYAQMDIDVAQPDMDWTMLRRPGQTLFPGSDAQGIVLVGPSMGGFMDETVTVAKWKMWAWIGLGLFGGYSLYKMLVKKTEEVY
jgi:hypothetical protein